jgi:hypothetical protein
MPLLIKNRKKFPAKYRHYQCLKGISIGGCVDSRCSDFDDCYAHAHAGAGKFQGWICFHHKRQLRVADLPHEVAHLLVNIEASTPWHGKKWYDKFVELGGYIATTKKARVEVLRFAPWLNKHMKVKD